MIICLIFFVYSCKNNWIVMEKLFACFLKQRCMSPFCITGISNLILMIKYHTTCSFQKYSWVFAFIIWKVNDLFDIIAKFRQVIEDRITFFWPPTYRFHWINDNKPIFISSEPIIWENCIRFYRLVSILNNNHIDSFLFENIYKVIKLCQWFILDFFWRERLWLGLKSIIRKGLKICTKICWTDHQNSIWWVERESWLNFWLHK